MLFRVVLPDGHVRKMTSDATSVASLCDSIMSNFSNGLPPSFILHYYDDDDFGDYFTLDRDDNIEDKMTVKIVIRPTDTANTAVSSQSGGNPSSITNAAVASTSSSSVTCDNLRTKDIGTLYALPKFDKDVKMALSAANVSYQKDGTVTQLNHGLKSTVLTRIVSDMYENYSAYPSTRELEVQ